MNNMQFFCLFFLVMLLHVGCFSPSTYASDWFMLVLWEAYAFSISCDNSVVTLPCAIRCGCNHLLFCVVDLGCQSSVQFFAHEEVKAFTGFHLLLKSIPDFLPYLLNTKLLLLISFHFCTLVQCFVSICLECFGYDGNQNIKTACCSKSGLQLFRIPYTENVLPDVHCNFFFLKRTFYCYF